MHRIILASISPTCVYKHLTFRYHHQGTQHHDDAGLVATWYKGSRSFYAEPNYEDPTPW